MGVGFNVSYRTVTCGGIIKSPQVITSPLFPSNYGANIDCAWMIDFSEDGQQIEV